MAALAPLCPSPPATTPTQEKSAEDTLYLGKLNLIMEATSAAALLEAGCVYRPYNHAVDWSSFEPYGEECGLFSVVQNDPLTAKEGESLLPDTVNASWIKGTDQNLQKNDFTDYLHHVRENGVRCCIACAAPLPEKTADFLDMLFKNGIDTIVKLTNDHDDTGTRAYSYLPLQVGERALLGNYLVTCTKVHPVHPFSTGWKLVRHDYNIRSEDRVTKQLSHFHVQDWHDGTPGDPKDLLELVELLTQHVGDRPFAAHCSSGIGRTGVLIGAYLLKRFPNLNALTTSFLMRSQRHYLGGTTQQHVAVHQFATLLGKE